jgi:hypothetical protein
MEIQGFEDYLIYQDGRVWSKKGKGKFLKPRDDGQGYHKVILYGEIKKQFKVHRLVAEHYIPNPENKLEVDHINRIRSDNRVENLRWTTKSENQQNTIARKSNLLGEKNIQKSCQNCFVFRKEYNGKLYYKSFTTLEEAIKYRDNFIAEDYTKLKHYDP